MTIGKLCRIFAMLLIFAGMSLVALPSAADTITPEEILQELTAGNRRFINGLSKNTDYARQIELTKAAQHPHSVFLSCMDSRVPPEIIFDQGIGNIFVIRNAGNIEDENVLGSMEYAVKFAGARLIVVMGHSHCGAVAGAIKGVKSGNLTQLVKQIKPGIPVDINHDGIVEVTARNSVRKTMHDIAARSSTIKQLLASGQIKIVGAFYDIETGLAEFLY
jgi:carbonic anhydrase